jgi:pSer/pThr/pTyr-binding forkhead associated (FHA) protein
MLEHGAALRFPIYAANGTLLLAQGTLINERLRRLLEVRGISLVLQASLKVLEGGTIGLEIPVKKSFFNLGRRAECDLQLASPVVSGLHCRIIKTEFAVLLRDLKSANGTFLNGRRVEEVAELKNDDQIRVGHFTFRVQIVAALAADSSEGETELKAWLLEDALPARKPISPNTRTELEIDLDRSALPK